MRQSRNLTFAHIGTYLVFSAEANIRRTRGTSQGKITTKVSNSHKARLENVLSIASGHIEQDMIHPQSVHDGVIDSLRFLATRTDSLARHLLRLIVMPGL